jgi:hypothetical protein
MSAETLKFEIKLNFPIFLGVSLIAHALLFVFVIRPMTDGSDDKNQAGKKREPLVVSIGRPNSKVKNTYMLKPKAPSLPSQQRVARSKPAMMGHPLNLADLSAGSAIPKPMVKAEAPKTTTPAVTKAPSLRPGAMPITQPTALTGIKYSRDDFKKMASDPSIQGGADLLTSKRVALNFEVPEGKDATELNESQLKLYGFLRRGAMKYVNSLSAEIEQFELQNPHLHFPLIDYKQTLTGRLVYDNQGNLKQIKMVRWSNNDKLQGFFESVLKRLENLQNPPKELWAETGEFTVFVTLQING